MRVGIVCPYSLDVPGGVGWHCRDLAEELEAQRQYLGIEQERFGERLRLSETLPASLRAALVPGLILQPLIENAVKYGVARTAQPVSIEILAEERAGRLVVTVRDDAVPDIASSGTGSTSLTVTRCTSGETKAL